MTLSLFSTYKGRQRDAASKNTAQISKAGQSIQSSVCHALVFLGMGVEGMRCGGDVTPSGKR